MEAAQRPVTLRASEPISAAHDGPAASSQTAPAATAEPKRRPFGISLFDRVTGGRASQEEPAAAQSPSPRAPGPQRVEEGPALAATRPSAEAAMARSEPREASQPGTVAQAEPAAQTGVSTSRHEEDLLEIPAFLRRQAN
jgi:cell division protein FtsZ